MHSKYIQNVFRGKLSHEAIFGVHQDDTDGFFFKIRHSNFKYEDKHVFEDCRNYKAIQGLWELLTKSKPDKMRSLFRTDKHINKYSCSLTSRELISPRRKTKTNKGLKYKQFISQLFNDKNQVLGNR